MVKSGQVDKVKVPLGRIAWRAFFLQACWNFQRMQNLGFAFAMVPLVRMLAKDKQSRIAMLKRHLEFFNTHPYCATIILGVIVRLEVDLAEKSEAEKEAIHRIKTGMMGPLAALGDTVFWAMLKPAAALVGVGYVFLAPQNQIWPAILGPVFFLAIFSIPHIGLHFWGMKLGYQRGIEIACDLRRFNPQLIAKRIALFIMVALGSVAAVYVFLTAGKFMSAQWAGALLLTAATGVFFLGLRKGIPAALLFYGLVGLAVVLAYSGVI